jgi:transposase InsO family protein
VTIPRTVNTARPHDTVHPVDEFASYNKEVIHLQLKPDAQPRQFPPRLVPLALQDQTYFELQEMLANGIIEPVTEPTAWCHPMLVTPKPNGRLRVCMDPRYLNEYLVRAVHPFPDMEQIFTHVKGAVIFSKIDLTHGFWNLKLDKASSDICVFSSPWGRFRYLRLPFGVSPAPEVFHRVVADVIRGLPNVVHYIDDILIYATTRAEHDALVKEVLQRLRNAGFSVCQEKCAFGKASMTFLGHHLSGTRISPDPLKLEALSCMQPPSNSAELFSFLGFVNYLARYVPRLAALAEPLRRLQSSKVQFEWTSDQDAAFRAIKKCLLASPGLAPFDPALPLVVATDASNAGIGGVLLQNDRPVLFVARSLTPAETRYAIIEKELLAVLFVLTRCHFYTFGRPVIVRTDHKPLLGLVRADAEKLSTRIRRFVERLFPYALEWEYVPGKEHLFPDALSRIPIRTPLSALDQNEHDWFNVSDAALLAALNSGGPVFSAIARATEPDVQFKALLACAANGWPPKLIKRDARRHLLQPYWALRDELRVVGPYLMRGHRVCVPRACHAQALAVLHSGHPGIQLMQQRAQNLFYWPGITADIYRHVLHCDMCAANQSAPRREPLLREAPASFPGEIVAADFFEYQKSCYLAASDAFSNYLFCIEVPSPSSTALLKGLRTIFLQTGSPRVFASDGGPAFMAETVAQFLRQNNCRHRVSSPRYAQSNGAAERAVQTLKALRRRCPTPDS